MSRIIIGALLGGLAGYGCWEKIMKTNIHPYERIARVVVGLAVTSLAFVGPADKWFLIGLVPAATGLLGWCPPYHLLGISTCPRKQEAP